MPYTRAEAEATVTVREAMPPALPPWLLLAVAGVAGAGIALLLASKGR